MPRSHTHAQDLEVLNIPKLLDVMFSGRQRRRVAELDTGATPRPGRFATEPERRAAMMGMAQRAQGLLDASGTGAAEHAGRA